MKNRILTTALVLFAAVLMVKAQSGAANNEIVPLPDGGFVAFMNKATWVELRAIQLRGTVRVWLRPLDFQ